MGASFKREAGEGGALNRKNRFFKPSSEEIFPLTVTFASGVEGSCSVWDVYQQDILNVKNCNLRLAHRNSPGKRSLRAVGSGLWLPVAQSGCRPCELLPPTPQSGMRKQSRWITGLPQDTPDEMRYYADADERKIAYDA